MGLINWWRGRRRNDWCKSCKCAMEQADTQLFAMPGVSVGLYKERTDPGFYRRGLCAVDGKADIPPGMYACRAVRYCCPVCGKQVTVLAPFLPVREEEKREGNIVFRDGELDDFLWPQPAAGRDREKKE